MRIAIGKQRKFEKRILILFIIFKNFYHSRIYDDKNAGIKLSLAFYGRATCTNLCAGRINKKGRVVKCANYIKKDDANSSAAIREPSRRRLAATEGCQATNFEPQQQ